MRRVVARVLVLAVTATGVLSVAGIVKAGAPKVSPTLAGPAGQGAVGSGDKLTFGGMVDPNATLVNAELRFRDKAGEPARDPIDVGAYTSLVGGNISGQFFLPSLCPSADTAEDCRQRLNDGSVALFVAVDLNGAPGNGTSTGVPIDLVAPYILRTALEAPNKVKVVFSEPVKLPDGTEELPTDWTIGGECQAGRPLQPPDGIEGDGAIRILTAAVAEDEDATPVVNYCPTPQRPAYQDRARRPLLFGGRTTISLDRIAPKIPVILSIADRPGKDILANDPSPTVRIGDLRPGHFGLVYLESVPGSGFQRFEDTFLGEAEANASGFADIQLPDLGTDRSFKLYGVARDRAKCTSEGTAECPNFSGGDLATYRLDTIIPRLSFAATDGTQVIVRFDEAIFGTDDPAQWTVSGVPPASVSGGGQERFLGGVNAPAGARVTWTRPASGGYTDAAGNEVESPLITDAIDFIPPVINVTDPITTVWTAAESHRLTGSVSKAGSLVEAFRDGTKVEQHQLGPDEKDFAIDVFLTTDATNSFVLRATDPLGNVNRQDTFLPGIIQDSTSPEVSVLAPAQGAFLRGGNSYAIRWEASDANFGSGPISIDFAGDGGPWTSLSAHEANDGEFIWQRVPTDVREGQIRITAEDMVGFTGEAISAVFTIDADAPEFAAVTTDAHHVAVQFTDQVDGTIAADEWTIDGVPAASASETAITSTRANASISRLLLETVPTQEIGRNDLPLIGYDPRTELGREEFHDEAGNPIPEDARTVKAEDGILPLIPSIETIAGQAAGGESGDATPDVEIGNIDPGDTAQVFVDSDGVVGPSGGDRFVGSAVAGEDGATVTTDTLGADADYNLYATARDPGGNVSDESALALYKLRSGILPAAPVIQQIAGQPADADVTANDPSPDVKVGSIAEGFVAEIYADTDGTSGISEGDRKLGEATAGEEGALVQTSDLGADGTYTLLAVARNAVGRRSATADDATYILDATNPAFTAEVLDSRHVAVQFTEPVSGMIAELEWRIDGMPANLTREPGLSTDVSNLSLETLQVQEIAIGASPEISYSPIAGEAASPAPAELRDDAGNIIESKITRAIALTPEQPGPGGPSGTQQPPAQPAEQPGGVPGEPTADLVCTIVGTPGNDILLGTEGPDVMCPQGGEDRIEALGGDDVVLGGTGSKLIEGGSGKDLLIGGSAVDRIYGGKGRDRLYGKGASDRLFGGAGKDRLVGGAARDRLNGGSAIDKCKGGAGRDKLLRCEGGKAR